MEKLIINIYKPDRMLFEEALKRTSVTTIEVNVPTTDNGHVQYCLESEDALQYYYLGRYFGAMKQEVLLSKKP